MTTPAQKAAAAKAAKKKSGNSAAKPPAAAKPAAATPPTPAAAPAAVEANTTEFAITKDMPIPAITRKGGAGTKYPFDKMEMGDSFFVPGVSSKSFGSTVRAWARRHGGEFTVRAVTENGKPGVRVWREV